MRTFESTDLSDRHKAALRLTDAFNAGGVPNDPALATDAREWFTAAELVDLAVTLFRRTSNKLRIALRKDIAPGGPTRPLPE